MEILRKQKQNLAFQMAPLVTLQKMYMSILRKDLPKLLLGLQISNPCRVLIPRDRQCLLKVGSLGEEHVVCNLMVINFWCGPCGFY
ncbi:hypothetical protein L1987_22755 [Smallanthus sonchifolius]|uniref:Uncharacterized protein n=1 Tax=Smallanthus sonchifolius TaxID=185202 RepID=A0ACB9IHG6_9ASTR|nr:hypothetical protein L1987_22755 [Smallanthus sonchifolius]